MFTQYKDAFFSANPNFKWYKLPAPPLRSISMQTRPDRHDSFSDPSYDDYDTMSPMSKLSHGSNDMDCIDNNAQHKQSNDNAIKPSVSLFKLADEAQMGGLNSLMMAVEMVNAKSPNSSTKAPNHHEQLVKVENDIEQGKRHFHCRSYNNAHAKCDLHMNMRMHSIRPLHLIRFSFFLPLSLSLDRYT